jgi:hypothetical protein
MQCGIAQSFKKFLLTPHYAAQRGVNYGLCHIVESHYSALFRIVGSGNSVLCLIALSCDSALCSIVRSQHIFCANFATIWKNILTC